MKIKIFKVNPFQINSYLYYDEINGESVLIDPGFYNEYEKNELIYFVSKNNLLIKYIINTHGHIDHVLGNKFAVEHFNASVYLNEADLFLYNETDKQALLFGLQAEKQPSDINFIENDLRLNIGNNDLTFMHTPGHTPGSVCIIDKSEEIIFCGDLIFKQSIGRTDLPGGNYETLIYSIKNKLFQLSNNFKLLPGHNEDTTIGYEKMYNPFLI